MTVSYTHLTARELSLDVLDNYEAYESRIVTMANKAYIRSINGEQELIDDIITVSYTHLDVYKRQT